MNTEYKHGKQTVHKSSRYIKAKSSQYLFIFPRCTPLKASSRESRRQAHITSSLLISSLCCLQRHCCSEICRARRQENPPLLCTHFGDVSSVYPYPALRRIYKHQRKSSRCPRCIAEVSRSFQAVKHLAVEGATSLMTNLPLTLSSRSSTQAKSLSLSRRSAYCFPLRAELALS